MEDQLLNELQDGAFKYFEAHTNPANGLVADSTWEGSAATIAAVGFGLTMQPVAVETGRSPRPTAAERTLTTLRFFANSHQGPEPDATGYQGFYYHFLDMHTGQRLNSNVELSTIDTAILMAGVLAAGAYFDQDRPAEREIRQLADHLFRRVNWQWAQNGRTLVNHGWRPESGFLLHSWQGYDEGILLYLLGLGAPDHPLPTDSYNAYTATYNWEEHYGHAYLHAAPLFIHHFPHVWVDFRGIQDEFMRGRGIDYFENTRRATLIHQQHAIANPHGFQGYGQWTWGITASEGPAHSGQPLQQNGRTFYGYLARGVPGPDDGTLSPWTAITSLPFAPEIALPTIRHYANTYPQLNGEFGLMCSLNPSFEDPAGGWFSGHYYGINEGPIVLMIENHRTGFVWQLMQRSPYLAEGLRRAGFR